MRYETEVILGIRCVGDKSKEIFIESMSMIDAIKKIAAFCAESTLTQRFQFTMARTREDVWIGLGLKTTLKDARRAEKATEIAGFLDDLFDAPAGGQSVSDSHTESTPNEPTFKPGLPSRIQS